MKVKEWFKDFGKHLEMYFYGLIEECFYFFPINSAIAFGGFLWSLSKDYPLWYSVTLFVVGLFFASFCAWRREHKARLEVEKVGDDFDFKERPPKVWGEGSEFRYYTGSFEFDVCATKKTVYASKTYISSIVFNGENKLETNQLLRYVRYEDPWYKMALPQKLFQRVHFVTVHHSGSVLFIDPLAQNGVTYADSIFAEHGEYEVTILVIGEEAEAKEAKFIFDWTGDFSSSTFKMKVA